MKPKAEEKPRELHVWRSGLSGEYAFKPGITRDWIAERYVDAKVYDKLKNSLPEILEQVKVLHTSTWGDEKIRKNIEKKLEELVND